MRRPLVVALVVLSLGCWPRERSAAEAPDVLPSRPLLIKPLSALAAPPLVFDQSLKERRDSMERIWKAVEENYYDPDFNGVDWKAVRERYRPMLDSLNSDEEFYKLMERMVGEL